MCERKSWTKIVCFSHNSRKTEYWNFFTNNEATKNGVTWPKLWDPSTAFWEGMENNVVKGTKFADPGTTITWMTKYPKLNGLPKRTKLSYSFTTSWETDGHSLHVKLREGTKLHKYRTDNCVKNRFYSRFRRSIRNVNELIKIFWKKKFKQLKPTFISKVIEIT